MAEGLVVWRGQRALGHDHHDGRGRHVGIEQVQEPPYASGRLARAGRAFEEELGLDGVFDEGELVVGKSKRGHIS